MSDLTRDINDFEYLAEFISGRLWRQPLLEEGYEEPPKMNKKVLWIGVAAIVLSIIYIILICIFLPGPDLTPQTMERSRLVIFSLNTNHFARNVSEKSADRRYINQPRRDGDGNGNDKLIKVIAPIKSLLQSIGTVKGKETSTNIKTTNTPTAAPTHVTSTKKALTATSPITTPAHITPTTTSTSSLSDNVDIIRDVLNKINETKNRDEPNKIKFAIEYNDQNGASQITTFDNPTSASQSLDDILNITNKSGKNPNQTEALLKYISTWAHDASISQQYYTLFPADPEDYSSKDAFSNDTKRFVRVVSELNEGKVKILIVTKSEEVIGIIRGEHYNNTDDSTQLCAIDRSNISNQNIASIVFDYTMTADDSTECPTTVPPTTTTTTPTSGNAPCYFVFVIDASEGAKHLDKEITAVGNVTKRWNLDGSGELQLAIMATGLPTLTDDVSKSEFFDNGTKWRQQLQTLIMNVLESDKGPTMSPQNISNVIASSYCNKSSDFRMKENGNVSFVIFTSYSNDSGINAALQHHPWLSCPTAKHESIFMVAIDGGSASLANLSLPSKDSFMRITQFNDPQILDLTNKITHTMCDCKPTDGHPPDECAPITRPPTTTTTHPPTITTATHPPTITTIHPPTITTATHPPTITTIHPPTITTTTHPPTITTIHPPTITTTHSPNTTATITISTTTTTTATTTTTPRGPPAPCFGYFAFLVDASNKAAHFQQEIWALSNITKHWNLDGSGKLFVTAADTGLNDEYLDNLDGFLTKRSDWDRTGAHLSANLAFNRADSPMSPTEISKLVSSTYCNKSSKYHIGENGNLKFIIFTSYSDEAGIDAAVKGSKPWLPCSMTEKESIFMVSVDGGSANLNKLSYPKSGLFMQMNSFSQNEIQSLTEKIILNMCDCTKLSDGSLPAGCLLPTPRPT